MHAVEIGSAAGSTDRSAADRVDLLASGTRLTRRDAAGEDRHWAALDRRLDSEQDPVAT